MILPFHDPVFPDVGSGYARLGLRASFETPFR
jgi:hypothetical protein